jgi:hypothetical protein
MVQNCPSIDAALVRQTPSLRFSFVMRQAVSNDTDIDDNGAIQIGGMTTTTTMTTVRLLKGARMMILKFEFV